MRVPDSLFVRFQPSFSVAGVFLLSVYPLRTDCTVFRPVGAWDESRAAHYAPLHAAAVKDLCFQSLVQRQNRPAEPFAANGIRNRLRAGVGFPIVQQQAVAAVKVAALPTDQAVRPLPLYRGHAVRCSVRFSLQQRQIIIWVIFHVVPPFLFDCRSLRKSCPISGVTKHTPRTSGQLGPKFAHGDVSFFWTVMQLSRCNPPMDSFQSTRS